MNDQKMRVTLAILELDCLLIVVLLLWRTIFILTPSAQSTCRNVVKCMGKTEYLQNWEVG